MTTHTTPPLTTWFCDKCGEKINSAHEGYVVWDHDEHGCHGFEVIHQGRCDSREKPMSQALPSFLGSDGLAYLTSMLTYGPLKENAPGRIKDVGEFVDFLRRMQLPHYEEARQSFSKPEVQLDFSDANEVLPYLPKTLKRISEDY